VTPPDPLRGVREALQQQGERHARLVDAFANGPGAKVARVLDEQAAGMRGLQRAMGQVAETVRRFQDVAITPAAAAATAGITRAVVTTTRNLRKVARVALQVARERYRRGRDLLAALLGRTSRGQAAAIARAPRVTTSREGPPGAAAPALRLVSSLVDAPGAPPFRVRSYDLAARAA
jgi:hypothetical protein